MNHYATKFSPPFIAHNSYKNRKHRIAEIIITRDSCQDLLMPIIAAFSQKNNERWLTWLTDKVPSKKQLLAYGVNLRTLRLIYMNQHQNRRWLTWEALAQGNSHTVITELEKLTGRDISAMESAAIQGISQGIIIKPR